MALDHLITARAAALFASDLPYQWHPGEAAVEAAISSALTAWGGVDGCVSALAAAYGDHPETAVLRMKWARQTIDAMRSTAAWTPPAGTSQSSPPRYSRSAGLRSPSPPNGSPGTSAA